MKLIAGIIILLYSSAALAIEPAIKLTVGSKAPFTGWLVTEKVAQEAYQLNLKLADTSSLLNQERNKTVLVQQKLDIESSLNGDYKTKISQLEKDELERRRIQPYIYIGIATGSIALTIITGLAIGAVAKSLVAK